MDWKRVKTILIALLLVTNVVLLASVLLQLESGRKSELRALEATFTLMERDYGLRIEMIKALPTQAWSFTVERRGEDESRLAESILGSNGFSGEDGGGGIYKYQSDLGTGEIRRGGDMEFFSQSHAGFSGEDFEASLNAAGLKDTAGSTSSAMARSVTVAQHRGGVPIVNSGLTCSEIGQGFHIIGRWIVSAKWEKKEASASRAQLAFELVRALDGLGVTVINGVKMGYYVQISGASDAGIIPVWKIDTDIGVLIFDLMEYVFKQ